VSYGQLWAADHLARLACPAGHRKQRACSSRGADPAQARGRRQPHPGEVDALSANLWW